MPKEGISLSLTSYRCAYCGLYTQSYVGFTQSYVGLSVCAANLMQYCKESFCLRGFRGSSFASVSCDSNVDVLNLKFVDRIFWLNRTQYYHNQVFIVSGIDRGEGGPCDPHSTRSLTQLLVG